MVYLETLKDTGSAEPGSHVSPQHREQHLEHTAQGGSVDGSGHLTLDSAIENDVDLFKEWLSTVNSPKVKVVDNWLKNYKFNSQLHDRFKQYFNMLDSVRGTDFAKTFNPSWT